MDPMIEVTIPKPMLYAGLYPADPKQLQKLKAAIDKVSLNDSSVSVMIETSMAFGSGWRLGFLGVLQMEVSDRSFLDAQFRNRHVLCSPV